MVGPITPDSPNAALRLMALQRPHPLDREDLGAVDLHLASFRMHDWDHEAEMDAAAHRVFLIEQQGLIASVIDASRMGLFDLYPGAQGLSAVPDPDERRRALWRWMSSVKYLLRDDAVRAWVDGDHAGAIERAAAMMRIARQLSGMPHADVMYSLVADRWAADALELLATMASHPSATHADRAAIRAALAVLDGADPLRLLVRTRRTIAAYDVVIADGLRVPDGSAELWGLIAQIHAADLLAEAIMRPMREALHAMDPESPAPSEGPAGLSTWMESNLPIVLEELGGMTADDLRRAYRRARPLVRVALDELAAHPPDRKILRSLRDRVEKDDTGIAALLGLPSLDLIVRAHLELMDARQAVWEMLED